jgi:N-acyl-phosphatidylethanolamine-hydrolysing phospholipase D
MRCGVPCLLFLLIALSVSSCVLSTPSFDEAALRRSVEKEKASDLYATHYKEGHYFNSWMPMEKRGFRDLLRWRLSGSDTYTDEEKRYRPAFVPNLKERILSMPTGDFIAWVGHNTFLVRVNGEYWLIDPIFSERALLPKRATPPALSADDVRDLPGKLNIVITHNHYDHFDNASIKALPESARVFVPMGPKDSVEKLNKENVLEMDWWQATDCGNGIRLACLPAQHWSRRISQGTDKTLWASFMITTPSVTIYIGGDSGYFIGYKEIGRVYPNIDYALLPTTAYQPRWFMHYAHMDVEEAIDAFQDLGGGYMIPTQWGTFQLSNEPIGYAALDLKRMIKQKGLDPTRFIIMDIGQILAIAGK